MVKGSKGKRVAIYLRVSGWQISTRDRINVAAFFLRPHVFLGGREALPRYAESLPSAPAAIAP
jgi:hypothetical protein